MIKFGCVADDFTGASDAASFLAKGGLAVQLFSGVPDEAETVPDDIQAAVIALKSRTQKTDEAVADTLAAARWLRKQGAGCLYLKYCATFDSTREGNIGPCADALMEEIGAPYTLLCPALPANGRTVREGKLYVNGIPLHESHMKDHPLTPMWDARIKNLIEPQSRYEAVEVFADGLSQDSADVLGAIGEFGGGREHFYVIPDYRNDEDGKRIAELFGDLPLLTGGSGLLEHLAVRLAGGENAGYPDVTSDGEALILSGSCSKPTLGQIACFLSSGGPGMKMEPAKLLDGSQALEDFKDFIANAGGPALIYSSDTAENVRLNQEGGREKVAELLESTTAAIAECAVKAGCKRLIVAGGETSGAVMQRLGYHAFRIGPSVSPGVPVMIPSADDSMRIVLKSGGFGGEDFFLKALEMTGA